MDGPSSEDDASRIETIKDCWELFDNTGEESLVLDYLADDVTMLPPGGFPISGKAAVADVLQGFPSEVYDVNQEPEELEISGDLAVDYVSVRGTKSQEDSKTPEDVSHKAIDVYRRDEKGNWKMIFSIWNDHA